MDKRGMKEGWLRPAALATAALTVGALVALAPMVFAENEHCEGPDNPYPVGRCGAFDRETVIFCYVVRGGLMVPATETNVVVIGSDDGVEADSNAKGVAYVAKGPTEAFLDDVWTAPFPEGNLWLEQNNAPGLQTTPATCAEFQWWQECDSWMGPYNAVQVAPDAMVV